MRFYDDRGDDDHDTAVQVPVQHRPAEQRRTPDPAAQLKIVRLLEQQGGHAESPGGMVQATVDAAGRISSIQIDPRLSALPLYQLSDHITQTCAAAFNQRLKAIAQIAHDHTEELDPYLITQITVMTEHLNRDKN